MGDTGMSEPKTIKGKINIGGYGLFVNYYGEGEYTVISESGLGHGSEDWSLIQREISSVAKTLSYDRVGIGNSDTTKSQRTCLVQVRALHILLDKVRAKPPYIIVAHSVGGLNARVFAATYPKEVAGIVFVDCSHEKQFIKLKGKQLKEMKEIFDSLEHSYDVISSGNEVKKLSDKDSIRNIPIIVLRAKQPAFDQNDLSALSKYSKIIHVKDCGHFIQSDQPQIIIDSIKELIEKTKK
jgi:pimeloyl-ACP methyl ester carboxylesterase